ncbi:FecR family protein [Arachidicoccus sp.]|uniref:FecR family protein n=1 Tax=Arachidicoccus sp. TaxID=1872624 RepID=UPI003D263A7C
MPNNRLDILFQQWCSGEINEVDIHELMELLNEADKRKELSHAMRNIYNKLKIEPFFTQAEKNKIIYNSLKKVSLKKKISIAEQLAIAAVILVFLGISSFFLFFKQSKKQPNTFVVHSLLDKAAPVHNKAILTLGNGKVIALGNTANGTLAIQGQTKIIKLKGDKIAFAGNSLKVTYNTLAVPRGSKPIELQLADGSKVWLNVASSITFPTAFVDKTRNVKITGEAYFEVAHNASKPFIVSTGKNEIQVLGTHFNVNAYKDEAVAKVTLLKGLVQVNHSLIITPGQQALIADNTTSLNSHPNLDEVMAWKNDEFIFNSATIPSILRELSKWYDVDIEYQSAIPSGHYSGMISRDNNLSQVLKILEAGGIKFQITKDKLIVL